MNNHQTALTHRYPLRPDFLAELTLPYDLTWQETERLSAFLHALASPARPGALNEAQAVDPPNPRPVADHPTDPGCHWIDQ